MTGRRRVSVSGLAASCAFYNEINYRRHQAYFERDNWSEAETDPLYDEYAPVLGTGTAQQLVRKSAEAWESFEELDADPAEDPSPPGYWGNREGGYPLRSVVRQDLYEIDWDADGSTIEIPVGKALNEKYNIPGRGYRVTLELQGTPRWQGKQCRLDISYDELTDCFRVNQPVSVQPDLQHSLRRTDLTHTLPQENTGTPERVGAIDVGANNTLTVVTDNGNVAIFQAPAQFRAFAEGLEGIADMQSRLLDWRYTSARIRRAYGKVVRQPGSSPGRLCETGGRVVGRAWSHACVRGRPLGCSRNPLVRDGQPENAQLLVARTAQGSTRADVRTLWNRSRGGPGGHTSSQCSHCQEDRVVRHGDTLTCLLCGLDAHADIVGAALILSDNSGSEFSDWFDPVSDGWPRARPAPRDPGRARDGQRYSVTYFQWDDHEWTTVSTAETGTLGSSDQRSVSKPASSAEATAGCVAHGGISSN